MSDGVDVEVVPRLQRCRRHARQHRSRHVQRRRAAHSDDRDPRPWSASPSASGAAWPAGTPAPCGRGISRALPAPGWPVRLRCSPGGRRGRGLRRARALARGAGDCGRPSPRGCCRWTTSTCSPRRRRPTRLASPPTRRCSSNNAPPCRCSVTPASIVGYWRHHQRAGRRSEPADTCFSVWHASTHARRHRRRRRPSRRGRWVDLHRRARPARPTYSASPTNETGTVRTAAQRSRRRAGRDGDPLRATPAGRNAGRDRCSAPSSATAPSRELCELAAGSVSPPAALAPYTSTPPISKSSCSTDRHRAVGVARNGPSRRRAPGADRGA